MFGIGVEEIGKALGAAAGACLIAVLTWLGTRKNRQDATAIPPSPAAMGIVLDGDTATALLREAKAIRDDLERWRTEDQARAKDDKIERLEQQLARVGNKTHANQADIADRQSETDRKLGLLLEALSGPNAADALRDLKIH